jgi:hypothetical protein
VLRLHGSAKKKKKSYKTPKKNKCKRNKVKLDVLKYCKVDENGKISRLCHEIGVVLEFLWLATSTDTPVASVV